MFDTVIFLHAGGGIAMTMAGIGALKFFFTAGNSVGRVPQALERTAAAVERQAQVAEENAQVVKLLEEIRVDREQIGRTLRIISRKLQAHDDEEDQATT